MTEVLAPALYLVATPIGNLGDTTFRACKSFAAQSAVTGPPTNLGTA